MSADRAEWIDDYDLLMLLQRTQDLCESASAQQDKDLRDKAANAIEFHRTIF
jgi:hypothetical protein